MLQVPLEIAFHNIESSAWAEQEIRARVADLEKLYDRLTSCRVRIDQRAKDRSGTIPPVVHIELGIPGRSDLVVSHEPDHLLRKYRHPDLHKAINEAFRIAARQLADLKGQRDGRSKDAHHDAGNQSLGQVAEITPEQDFGFLMTKEACCTSTATRCCAATSIGSSAATRFITTRTWATPAPSPPRCASSATAAAKADLAAHLWI
jgi:ribosome-associated translation inhibitor RaiA